MNCTHFVKQPNLKLKTWPKLLLGFLPLAFELPGKKDETLVCMPLSITTERSSLKLKTRPNQFKGYLPLAFELPAVGELDRFILPKKVRLA